MDRRLRFGIFLAPFHPVDEEWSSANRTELMEAGRQANVVAAQKPEAERCGRAGA